MRMYVHVRAFAHGNVLAWYVNRCLETLHPCWSCMKKFCTLFFTGNESHDYDGIPDVIFRVLLPKYRNGRSVLDQSAR